MTAEWAFSSMVKWALCSSRGMTAVGGTVEVRVARARSADEKRRSRLVDEDRVHFVDDAVVEFPLDVVFEVELHVVA